MVVNTQVVQKETEVLRHQVITGLNKYFGCYTITGIQLYLTRFIIIFCVMRNVMVVSSLVGKL